MPVSSRDDACSGDTASRNRNGHGICGASGGTATDATRHAGKRGEGSAGLSTRDGGGKCVARPSATPARAGKSDASHGP